MPLTKEDIEGFDTAQFFTKKYKGIDKNQRDELNQPFNTLDDDTNWTY